jgi:stage II sporulation protein P
MRKKEKILKGINLVAWTGIILLAAYILIKGGIVFGTEDNNSQIKKIANSIISEFSVYMAEENSELLSYTLYPDSSEFRDNMLLKYISIISPLQFCVVEDKQEQDTTSAVNYTEDTENSTGQPDKIILKNTIEKLPGGKIGFISGDYYEESETTNEQVKETFADSAMTQKLIQELFKTKSINFLLKNFYTVDSTTSVDNSDFNISYMLKRNFAIKKDEEKPQILIYHTHATSEAFSDSVPGDKSGTVVGVGETLTKILEEKYGYNVIHDESEYDVVNGRIDRNKAFNAALANVKDTLKKYPSIKVIIDLHRDGVQGDKKKVADINGKKTAQVMFFNGLSRNRKGPIDYLFNKNLKGNLAFSLQLKLKAMEEYPNLTVRNYVKGYRYNLHVGERCLLIELGNQNNTLEEANNAMEPLADILNQVLSGE